MAMHIIKKFEGKQSTKMVMVGDRIGEEVDHRDDGWQLGLWWPGILVAMVSKNYIVLWYLVIFGEIIFLLDKEPNNR